jgi:colicin import membrane protein
VKRRQEADQARAQAVAAQAEAERLQQGAQKATSEAAAARAEAEKARATALADLQAAVEQRQAAEAAAEKARQDAAKAESEKVDLRAQLLGQLNSILQARDSARGLSRRTGRRAFFDERSRFRQNTTRRIERQCPRPPAQSPRRTGRQWRRHPQVRVRSGRYSKSMRRFIPVEIPHSEQNLLRIFCTPKPCPDAIRDLLCLSPKAGSSTADCA